MAAEKSAICGACLSRGRLVAPLGAARAARVLRAAAELSAGAPDPAAELGAVSQLPMCWECRANVERTVVFCDRVRRAQTVLTSEHLAVLADYDNDASMSTLGRKTKIGFDFEFFREIEQNEIECPDINPIGTDAFIIYANENTLFDGTLSNEIIAQDPVMTKSAVKVANEDVDFCMTSTISDELSTQNTSTIDSMPINITNKQDECVRPSKDCHEMVMQETILFENTIIDTDLVHDDNTDAISSEVNSRDTDQLKFHTNDFSFSKNPDRSPSKDGICNEVIAKDEISVASNDKGISPSNNAKTIPGENDINCEIKSQDSDQLRSNDGEISSDEDEDSDSSGQSDPSWDVALSPSNITPVIDREISSETNKEECIEKDTEKELDSSHVIVMKDLTKVARSKVSKNVKMEEPMVTIKTVKGGNVKEAKLSDFKVNQFLKNFKIPKLSTEKCKDAIGNLTKSPVTIKMTPALEYVPLRPGRVSTTFMSEQEMMESREDDRNTEQYIISLFKCETCIIGFNNGAFLEEHNQSKHSPEIGAHVCDICKVRLPTALNVRNHRRTHYHLYVCSACGYTQRRLADVNRHYADVHEADRSFPCGQCGQLFLKFRQLKYHREKAHMKPKPCPHCDKTFTCRSTYNRHLELHTGAPLYECAVCGKCCRGKALLAAHTRTHGPRGTDGAYCAECDAHFKSKYIYRQHLRTSRKHVAGDDLKHGCDKCDKRFTSPGELRTHHDIVHLHKELFKCEACDKNYLNARGLKLHVLAVHEGVRPAKDKFCDLCEKGFSSKTILATHRRTHTGERPHACAHCGATFRQSGALYKHTELVHGSGGKKPKSIVQC